MQLIKINADKVQIRSDSFLKGIALNDVILVSDSEKGVQLVCTVESVIRNEDTEQFDYEGNLIEQAPSGTIECAIIGSIVKGKFVKCVDRYPTTNVSIEKISDGKFYDILKSDRHDLLPIGKYSNYGNIAYISGNKFFQRHSAILGNTGSGKSVTVASLLEKLSGLNNANIVVFDIHGEYKNLSYAESIKIGNSGLPFPIWMLPFKDFYSGMLKMKEESAITQIAALRSAFYEARRSDVSENIPIAYSLENVLRILDFKNGEEIETGEYFKTGDKAGLAKTVKGELFGKLFSVINLIEDKLADKRYKFMTDYKEQNYLFEFLEKVFDNSEKKVKVIDFSDIPHDVMPSIIAAVTKLIYDVQLKQKNTDVLPLQIICDEAHVYMPNDSVLGASQRRLLEVFETIAKEGRKFGISLMIVSQRPSDINRTIIAQCANYIVLKISNEIDKQYIKSILPDGSKGAIDEINLFSPGDCLIIGDSSSIVFKIKIDLPSELPKSSTIDTFDVWNSKCNYNSKKFIYEITKEDNLNG